MTERPKILQHVNVCDEGAHSYMSGIDISDCPYCAIKQYELYDAWTTGWIKEREIHKQHEVQE